MFPWLPPKQALANPDTYAELVGFLAQLKPGDTLPTDIGTYPKDTYDSVIKDDNLRNTKRALAFVERYLVHTEQNLNRTHRAVWKCVTDGKKLKPGTAPGSRR